MQRTGEGLENGRQKGAHGIMSFARELLIVVVGVVIAIGLGQAVDAAHWRDSVAEARDSLRNELRANDDFYAFRVAVSACVGRRLAELNSITEDAAAHRQVAPVGDLTLHIGSLLADDVWQSERAGQTLVHLPKAELERFSRTYSQQIDIRAWLNRETELWAGIRLLEGAPGRLTPSDITLVRKSIQEARATNYLVTLNAAEQLEINAALGVTKTEAKPAEIAAACAPLLRAPPARPFTTY